MFGAFPIGEAGQSRKWCFGQAFRSERLSGGGPESEARPSGRRGEPESEAGAVPPRPGLPVGDWIALLACRLGIWADP